MIIGSRNWHHTPVPMQRFRFVHAERIEPGETGQWVSYKPVNSRRIDRWSAGVSQFECPTDISPNASTQRCRLFSQTECLGAGKSGSANDPTGFVGTAQGNRVKKSCGNETCEIVVVPGGDFAFGAEAWLTGSLADQIVGHVL